MKTGITTLEQAGQYLIQSGVVDFNNMTVEGKQLLEVCGFRTDSDLKKSIERQIEKHNFKEDVDFNKGIDAFSKSRRKPMVYEFTMNAANHVLLAAMTDKGKAARQEAIDKEVISQSSEIAELRELMLATTKQTQSMVLELKGSFEAKLEEKQILIHKKSTPISLSKMYGKSSKVVQATNLWLESEGYQTQRYTDQKRDGWTLTEKGRDLGTQMNEKSIFWIPEIKDELPSIQDLLSFAERLGLTDMRNI